MSARSQITKDLNESVRTILGLQTKVLVKYMVKYEVKAEKFENRVLVFTPVRIYLLAAKVPTRVDWQLHYLEIIGIESKKSTNFSIITNEKTYTFSTFEDSGTFNSNADVILTDLSSAIKQIFPTIPLKYIIKKIEVSPVERVSIFSDEFRTDPRNIGPCGGFSLQYACICDLLGIPYKEEIAWDIDTIYLSHDYKVLNLRDFDHMEHKDFLAMISVLEYNTYFRGLKIKNTKLSTEILEKILHVLKRSMWLEEIHFESIGLRYDFVNKLSTSLVSNSNSTLRIINLSFNQLEDKGVISLASSVAKIYKGLAELKLSHCGFTAKGCNQLFNSMLMNQNNLSTLTKVDLSGNNLKDDIHNLYNFLAQPNIIEYLDISKTDTTLESLFGALLRGCSTHLAHLNVSYNVFGTKKGKEIPPSFKQFFTSTLSLKYLNISNCKLQLEALKHLLLGLACNESTCAMSLNISNNSLGQQGAHVLESCIHGVRVLSSLDISDNNLDYELSPILLSIGKNPSIRALCITKCFSGIKLKNIPVVMESLVSIIQRDDFLLRELDLSDNKLKHDLHNFINALSSNQTIEILDISGNMMGDIGARLLSKALQINNKLKSISMDRNNITIQGYSDIVHSLKNNHSVKNIPFPLHDIAPCLKGQPEKTDYLMKTMQEYLHRNNNIGIKRVKTGFRLQHSFLLSSTNQLIDKLVFEIQENSSSQNDESTVQQLLEDAENCKKLLPFLQECVRMEAHPVEIKFNKIKSELHDAIKSHLEQTMKEMLRMGAEKCPKIFSKQNIMHELKKSCEEKLVTLSDDYLHLLIVNSAGSEIMNKICEIEECMAIMISEKATDEILEALTRYQQGNIDLVEIMDSKLTKDITRSKSNEDGLKLNQFFPQKIEISPGVDAFKLEYLNLATPHHLSKKRLMTKKIRPQSVVPLGIENLSIRHIPSDYLNSPTMSYKSQSQKDSNFDDDSITDLPSQSTLQHLVKNRPKRNKTRAPTKPLITDVDNELEEGMDTFFKSATPSTLTPLVSPTSDSCSSLSFAERFSDIASDSTPLMDDRKVFKTELASPIMKNSNILIKSMSNENFGDMSALSFDNKSPAFKLKNTQLDKSSVNSSQSVKPHDDKPDHAITCDNNDDEIVTGGSIIGISSGKCLQDSQAS